MDSWRKLRRILQRPRLLDRQSLIMRSLSSWATTELRSADPISPLALEMMIGKIQSFRISPLSSTHPSHQARTDSDGGDDPGRDPIAPAALEMFGKIQPFLISPLPSPRSPHLPTSPAKARANDAGDDLGVEDDGQGSSKELNNKRGKEKDEEETRLECSSCSLGFPPPISTIGKGGKPRVYLKSFKEDGRFVLKSIRVPTQQCLQATRENGRLMLFLYDDEEEQKGSPVGGEEEEIREEVDLAGKEARGLL